MRSFLCMSMAISLLLTIPSSARSMPLPDQAVGIITGRVTDARTGQPLSAVQVYIAALDVGVLSQQNGAYLLGNVPGGTYTLSVQRIGFRIVTAEVIVADGTTVVLDFSLSVEALALDEIIVTGTAGGTRRRALGAVVERMDVEGLLSERAAVIHSLEDALFNRVPGVSNLVRVGVAGGGARVRIRVPASVALASDPLVYVDGVRVTSDRSRATGRSTSVSRLNDINPNDIASIEVIKGPAAATLYGTEASNGVIQIITKRGAEGAPVFTVSADVGANWLPQNTLQTFYTPDPARCPAVPCSSIDDLVPYQLYDSELARRGFKVFTKAPQQNYNFSVRGGTQTIQYFFSLNRDDQAGVVPWNYDERNTVRAAITVTPSDALTITVNGSYMGGENSDADSFWTTNFWYGGQSASYLEPDGKFRGFSDPFDKFLPETKFQIMERSRSIWSIEARHQATDWLSHRVVAGFDRYFETDVRQVIKDGPASEFWTRRSEGRLGVRMVDQLSEPSTTLDFSGTAGFQLTDAIRSETSYGFQYYGKTIKTTEAEGTGFATSSLRTVSSAATSSAGETFVENTTVGLYVQEQFAWRDRIFLTGAVRGDDNSAFGTDYDAAIYPKVSLTWVLHEEPFWANRIGDLIGQFRLRGAWGRAGQQPDAFAAARLYTPATGPGSTPVLIAQSLGNPDLGPEVGEELELGFDAEFLERVSLSFTHFWRSTKDALVTEGIPASLGIPTPRSASSPTRLANIGKVSAWGTETLLTVRALTQDPLRWDLGLNLSTGENRVDDMGSAERIKVGLTRAHREGFPLAFISVPRVVSADFVSGDRGPVTNVMCDGGTGKAGIEQGGAPVPCSEAGPVFWGNTEPKLQANLNSTITLFRDWTLSATIGGLFGHTVIHESVPARSLTRRATVMAHLQDNNIGMAHLQTDRNALGITKGDFVRFRELALSYAVPESVASRIGADRARISVGLRNFWRIWWREPCPPVEPRACAADPEHGTARDPFRGENSGAWPPLASMTAGLRLSF